MRKSLQMLSAAALVAAPMVLGVASSADARGAVPKLVAAPANPAAVPNTDIKGSGATLKYKPAKLTAHVFSQSQCASGTSVSFSATNTTNHKATMTSQGSPIFRLPPHTRFNLCLFGSPGTLVLGLKGSAHVLTVTGT